MKDKDKITYENFGCHNCPHSCRHCRGVDDHRWEYINEHEEETQ